MAECGYASAQVIDDLYSLLVTFKKAEDGSEGFETLDGRRGAMEGETAIEKSIREFVYTKIQEQVFLDVSKSNTITVKIDQRSKHGSTALAEFWLRVLNDRNNYPMPKFPYRKQIDKHGSEKVILKVESVYLTTFMSTGTLMIQGNNLVLEWFKTTFPSILSAYDASIKDPQPQLMDNDTLREIAEDSMTHQLTTKVDRMSLDEIAEGGNEGFETLDGIGGGIKVWDKRTLEEKLEAASKSGVFRGKIFIYPIWKTLLNKWLADVGSKVYLVTPFLDEQRMEDVCRIALLNEAEDRIEYFIVREECNKYGNLKSISDIKKAVKRKITQDDNSNEAMKGRLKSIYEKIEVIKYFHCKFMCCVHDNEAEVFITSANFHKFHFVYHNFETVQYIKTTKGNFKERFLEPLLQPSQIKK